MQEICSWNALLSDYPPPMSATPKRGPKGGFVLRCISYMSYSKYTTDICLNSDAPKQRHVSYQLPPPYRLPAMIVITAAVEGRYVSAYMSISHILLLLLHQTHLPWHTLIIPIRHDDGMRVYLGYTPPNPPYTSFLSIHIMLSFATEVMVFVNCQWPSSIICLVILYPPLPRLAETLTGCGGVFRRYVFNYHHRSCSLNII